MTYQILNCDGTLLLNLNDDIVDTTTTSLSLIGKSVSGYGQYITENFIQLLENSASPNPPNAPQTGQLWFNSTATLLNVYTTGSWVPVATTDYVNEIIGNGMQSYVTQTYVITTVTSLLGSYATESYVAGQITASQANPALTGIPTAPTAAPGTDTTQIATTAFVTTAEINGGTINNTPIGRTTPLDGYFTTISATESITPSTTNGIVGTTLGDNANAGSIGEYIEVTVGQTNGVAMSASNTNTTIMSFTLSPGDWNVWASVATVINSGCTVYSITAGPSSTNSTPSKTSGGCVYLIINPGETGANNIGICLPCGTQRFNVSVATVINLVMSISYSGGTVYGYGGMFARRMR
jgi:hypothetical protein